MADASTAKQTQQGTGGGRRRALEQVAGSASSLLLIAITLMVNYLAFRHYDRLDWTSQGMYTLSDKSRKVIEGLDEDLDIYLFMSQGEAQFADTDELLKRYRAASDRIKVHYVDPDREPGEFKVLAQRFGILEGVTMTGETRADVAAVVAKGDETWHVGREDLVGFDYGPMDGEEELNVKAEQALTGAIVQVQSGRATKVCVTEGHGEWSLDEAAPPDRSLQSLETGLRHDNIEWKALPTLGKKKVPEDCDAVLVLGPQRAFSEAEAKLIVDYVKQGGNALLALEPVIEHDTVRPTGFESALSDLGVRVDPSLVIELDAERLLTPNTIEFVTTDFGDHVTTRPLVGAARVLIPMARSLSTLGTSPELEVLLRTSDKAFAATDISRIMAGDGEPERGPDDIAGPIDLAYALRVGVDPDEVDPKPGGRLVIVGDSDFVSGPLLEAPELANFHLASAWIGWLTEREALIEIPPKKVKTGSIVFTQEDLMGLFFRVVVLLPGAALLLGIAMWLNRRA